MLLWAKLMTRKLTLAAGSLHFLKNSETKGNFLSHFSLSRASLQAAVSARKKRLNVLAAHSRTGRVGAMSRLRSPCTSSLPLTMSRVENWVSRLAFFFLSIFRRACQRALQAGEVMR